MNLLILNRFFNNLFYSNLYKTKYVNELIKLKKILQQTYFIQTYVIKYKNCTHNFFIIQIYSRNRIQLQNYKQYSRIQYLT